jgi:DNA-binding transcriptional ArsR family regulator
VKTGKESEFGDIDLSRNHRPLQAPIGADGGTVPGTPLSGGLRRNPREAPLLSFVPVTFTVYRPLKPRLRWAMQCLVSFADRAGRCWPSIRKLAEFAGLSKSAMSRHLAALVEAGVVTRKRRPGRGYEYEIDRRFLPRAPVSHPRAKAVPQQAGQETDPPKQTERTRKRARFANREVSFGEIPDDRAKWQARLRSWHQSGFWLPLWGPRPNQPGCFAPLEMLLAGA